MACGDLGLGAPWPSTDPPGQRVCERAGGDCVRAPVAGSARLGTAEDRSSISGKPLACLIWPPLEMAFSVNPGEAHDTNQRTIDYKSADIDSTHQPGVGPYRPIVARLALE